MLLKITDSGHGTMVIFFMIMNLLKAMNYTDIVNVVINKFQRTEEPQKKKKKSASGTL